MDQLVDIAWSFLIRLQLLTAIFHGDLLAVGAWALRLLAVKDPWGFLRQHGLVVHVLEHLVDVLARAGTGGPVVPPMPYRSLQQEDFSPSFQFLVIELVTHVISLGE